MSKEEQQLFNALKAIDNRESVMVIKMFGEDYLKSLETMGYCKCGWDTYLTEFGRSTLNRLHNLNW